MSENIDDDNSGNEFETLSGTEIVPSGARPAESDPRPSPSGTSGRLSENNPENQDETSDAGRNRSRRRPRSSRERGSPANTVPDVPDAAGPAPDDEGGRAGRGGPDLWRVVGVVSVGVMTRPREEFDHLENPDLRELLTMSNLPDDTVIEVNPKTAMTILDADTHDWRTPPTEDELGAILMAVEPAPDAAWRTHGNGLKLVYIGASHRDRALAAAFRLPASMTVELLSHTRHPLSGSSKHPGARCGTLGLAVTPGGPFEFRSVGHLTVELKAEAMRSLHVEPGGRYDHDHCPLDRGADSGARDCVVALGAGVFCHWCAARGTRFSDRTSPGFYPYAAAVGTPLTVFDAHAVSRAHWTHAQHVLRHDFPNRGDTLLREAYRRTLETRYTANDPRIGKAFDHDLDVVWGDGLWLDARNLDPTVVDNDTADELPFVLDVRAVGDRLKTKINKARRATVKHRTPAGYRPLRPVIGISFNDDQTAIPVVKPPAPRFAFQLLDDPMPEEEAFDVLRRSFPGVDRIYVKACLAAAICGEARLGQPPMLICTGPSGSGKQQHIRLAASFVGDDITKLPLPDDDEKFFRAIGASLSGGRRFLVLDELGKTRDLASKIKNFYALCERVTWRPLYQTRSVTTPFRGALFLPCVRFPDFVVQSQEFIRRTRRVHLYRELRDWQGSCGGDATLWRDRTAENARVANSILTHTWRLSREHSYRFQ